MSASRNTQKKENKRKEKKKKGSGSIPDWRIKIWQLKAMHDSGFSFSIKDITETTEDINKTCRLDNSVVKVLISWIS